MKIETDREERKLIEILCNPFLRILNKEVCDTILILSYLIILGLDYTKYTEEIQKL